MEGEPRVRRPAGRPPYRSPRGRRNRGQAPHSLVVRVLRAARVRARSDSQGARRRTRRRHCSRPTEVTVTAANAQDALEQASLVGRVLLPRHGHRLRAVRRPGRPLRRHRLQRLGVQGQRRLAARRRRQGRAEGRRSRALVLRDVRAAAAGRRRCRSRASKKGCYVAQAFDDNGKAATVTGLVVPHRLEAHDQGQPERRRLSRPASGRARARDGDRRGPLERREVRHAVVLLLAFVVTGCGGEREHGTATLWVTKRPRCARRLLRHRPGGADGDAGSRPQARHHDALRRPVRRSRSTASRAR